MKVVTLNFIEKFIYIVLNIHFVEQYTIELICLKKGPVTGYGKLTMEFAHAWNFMKLCALFVLVMTAIIMVYSPVNTIHSIGKL